MSCCMPQIPSMQRESTRSSRPRLLFEAALTFFLLPRSWNTRKEKEREADCTDNAHCHDKNTYVFLDRVFTSYGTKKRVKLLPKSVPASITGIILHDFANTCVGYVTCYS